MSIRSLALVLATLTLACDATPAPAAAEASPPAPGSIEARIRVRVAPAQARPLAGADELTGIVEPFAVVVVAAETAARIETRHIERGERVEEGALLYTLDDSRAQIEYRRAQASLDAREGDVDQARSELRRSATLREREGISAAAHERSSHAAKSAEAAEELARISRRAASRGLRDAKIRAPFTGIVAEFHAERGDFVGPGAPVVTLVDLSRVRLRVGLTAAELELAQVGARVPVSFADLGGQLLEAELRSVSPLADPRTGTYAAELWLDNPGEKLRQGMLGRAEFELEKVSAGSFVTIPRAAVIRRGRGFSVWVVDDHGEVARVEARALVLGRSDSSHVAVLDGLEAGERVVIEGMFALREQAAVVIEQSEIEED